MFRSGLVTLFRTAASLKNVNGLCPNTAAGLLQDTFRPNQAVTSTDFVRTFASGKKGKKGKSAGDKCKPKIKLIECPKKQEKNDCLLDLTQPPIGYYDLGYCRPPCEDLPKNCQGMKKPKKGEKKKKVCCMIKVSRFRIDPCKIECEPVKPPCIPPKHKCKP